MSNRGPFAKRKMFRKERRRHFFINKPLQLRYLFTLTFILLVITLVSSAGIYFGIWGGILDAFSNTKIQNDLLTAARLQGYEEVRAGQARSQEPFSTLSLFRQAERLSQRQQEIFKEILDQANQNLMGKLLLLFLLIAWGTIFVSHKIAGPLYHFETLLRQIAQGDLAIRCQLRKFDEAKSVAQALNQALEFLDSKISELKKMVRENEKTPDRLFPSLKEELSKFKTSADR